MKTEAKNIGLDVKPPTESCNDKKCPFHGNLKVHGNIYTGKLIKDPLHKTTTIIIERIIYLPKYERYEKKNSKIKAHLPSCLAPKKGDTIKVIQTRPISKTKSFVVIEVIK